MRNFNFVYANFRKIFKSVYNHIDLLSADGHNKFVLIGLIRSMEICMNSQVFHSEKFVLICIIRRLECMCRVNQRVWTTSDFSRECVQPRPPPSERTAGDDLMLACCHQLHVTIAVFPFVPVHKVYLVLLSVQSQNLVVLFRPCHASWVAKNIEYGI